MGKKILSFLKEETVLCVSAALALVSCFLVPPDSGYAAYINWDTIVVLFCLMTVTAGLSELGVFRALAETLLRRLKSRRMLTLTLVALCFFGSMLITNDVALITFVPLALLIAELEGGDDSLCLTVTLMTIAANLGSMLTPIGNPQNLYIYSVSGLSLGAFTATVAPYALLSAALLTAAALRGKNAPVKVELSDGKKGLDRFDLVYFLFLFAGCILAVAKLLSIWTLLPVVAVAVAIKNWRLLLKPDYSLLATFLCFFVFIGNMGRFEPFKNAVLSVLEGHVLLVSAALSQVISNVPAALLLGGFTTRWRELLVGVNIGGLGTLIASMASLISYKHLARRAPALKGRYFRTFTLWNLGFLAALLLLALILKGISI